MSFTGAPAAASESKVHGTGDSDEGSRKGEEDRAAFSPDQVAVGRDAACICSCDRLFKVLSAERRPVLVLRRARGFAIFFLREEGEEGEVEVAEDGDRAGYVAENADEVVDEEEEAVGEAEEEADSVAKNSASEEEVEKTSSFLTNGS